MEELSIEEKAKAYDEAIEKFDVILNLNTVKESGTIFADDVRKILPELKESEDEKTEKEILDYIIKGSKSLYDVQQYGKERFEKWIAWLEAQGEHANFRNKIQIGDKVTRNEDGVLVNLSQLNRVANKQGEQKLLYVNDNAKEMFIKALERVEEQNNKGYKLTDCDKNSWWEDFKTYTSCIIEQKPAYTKEYDFHGTKFIPKFAKGDIIKDKKCGEVSTIDGFSYDTGLYTHTYGQFPITIQDNYEIIEQKPAEWSEEDEKTIVKMRDFFIRVLGDKPDFTEDKRYEEFIEFIDNRLKSIRPQNWKPSKEQMIALNYVVNFMASSERPTENDLYYNILKSLREQLKKLREE